MSNPTHAVHVRMKSRLGHDEIVEIMKQRAPEFRALEGLEQKYYLHDPESGENGGAGLGDVDDEVAPDTRLAAEPPAGRNRFQLAPFVIAGLNLGKRREVVGARANLVLGELAFGTGHLAAAAQSAAAANRIDVDAQALRGLEYRCTDSKSAPSAGR